MENQPYNILNHTLKEQYLVRIHPFIPFKRFGEPTFEVDAFEPEKQKDMFYITISVGLDIYGPKPNEDGKWSETEEITIAELTIKYMIVLQKTSDISVADFDAILHTQIPNMVMTLIQFFLANLLSDFRFPLYFVNSPNFEKLYEEKLEKEAKGNKRIGFK